MTRTGTSSKKYRVKSVGNFKPKRTQIAKKRKAPEPAESDQAFAFKTKAEVTVINVDDDNDNASSASSGTEGKLSAAVIFFFACYVCSCYFSCSCVAFFLYWLDD